MTECVRRAWMKHGASWTRLTFDQQHQIIKEYEAGRPPRGKPAPVRNPGAARGRFERGHRRRHW